MRKLLFTLHGIFIVALLLTSCKGEEDYYKHGVELLDKNMLRQAKNAFKMAIDSNPDYAEAYYGLGNVYFKNKKYDEAKEYYSIATKKDSLFHEAFSALANVYSEIKEHENAMHHYRRAVQINPNSAEYHFKLGLEYGRLGLQEQETAEYQRALEIDQTYQLAKAGLSASESKVLNQKRKKPEKVYTSSNISPLVVTSGKSGQISIACEIYDKFRWVVRNNYEFLSPGHGAYDPKRRQEMKRWLLSLDFRNLYSPSKEDFEEFRNLVINHLDNPPPNRENMAKKVAEFTQSVIPLLVDLEIDEMKAVECGCDKDIAKKLQANLGVGKASFFIIQQKIDTKDKRSINDVTKFYIEYLAIWAAMHQNKERPVMAQVALLAMNPRKLNGLAKIKDFTKLHEGLLRFSRAINQKDASLQAIAMYPGADFIDIMYKYDISENDIRKHGNAGLAALANELRQLVE